MSLDFFIDKQDFLIHELKFKIRQTFMAKDVSLTDHLLGKYKNLIKDDSSIDQQFFLLYHKRITSITQKNVGHTEITLATFEYGGDTFTSITDAAGNVYTLGYSSGKLRTITKK